MGRLVTFGCSYTHGYTLEDFTNIPNDNAWPKLLAHSLKKDCLNLGYPGYSNKQIWHTFVNTKFQRGDIAVILWTHHARTCLFTDNNKVLGIVPWNKGDISTYYFKNMYNTRDHTILLNLYMEHITYKCRYEGVKVYHVLSIRDDIGELKTTVADKTLLDFEVDKSLDDAHPGIESHKLFAKYLKQYMETN